MTRTTSKSFVAGAFAVLLGGTMLSTPALAGDSKLLISILEDDDSITELYQDQEDGHFWCLFRYANGSVIVYDPTTNPNPNDDTTGKGSHSDKPDVAQMIKVGAATYKVRIAPADSPELMGHLHGTDGLGPHYNPGDDDNGHGHGDAPTHSMEVKKTDDEIRQEIAVANEIARQLANLGSAMGDGDEGGTESPTGPNKNGKHGDTGDDGNYTEGQDKDVGKTEKDLLGAKPELVNPPHWERTGASGHDHAASGAGGAGGGAGHGGLGGGGGHTGMANHG